MKAIVLAALLLLTSPVFHLAAKAESCFTTDQMAANIRTKEPEAVIRIMDDTTTQAFLAEYNAVPPQSDIVASSILAATKGQHPQAFLAFFDRQGCLVHATITATALVEAITHQIERDA